MHEQYGDEVLFVGVAGRSDEASVDNFIAETGVGGFTHAFDEDGSVWAEFGVVSQPSFAFIDAEGNTEVEFGRQGEDSLTERLDDLLQAA